MTAIHLEGIKMDLNILFPLNYFLSWVS